MFSEKRRSHWSSILKEIFKAIKDILFMIIISIFSSGAEENYFVIAITGIAIIIGIYKYIITKFNLTEDSIIVTKGSISRKKLELPFSKINTVDEEQTIIDRIFKTCTVKIDSGATSATAEEVKVQLKLYEAKELKRILLAEKQRLTESTEGEKADADVFKVNSEINEKLNIIYKKVMTPKEIILYSITKKKLLGVISFAFFVLFTSTEIYDAFDYDIISEGIEFAEYSTSQLLTTRLSIVIFALIFLIGSFILVNIITIIYEWIKLYNFTIENDGKKIYLSYGLLKTKKYTFEHKNIHSIKLKQSLIQRWLKLYSIEAVVMGFGDDQKEKSIIYPIVKEEFLNDLFENVIPDFKNDIKITYISKKIININIIFLVLFYIMIHLVAVFTLGDLVKEFYTEVGVITIVVVLLPIIISIIQILSRKHNGIGSNKNLMVVCNSIIGKKTTIIRQSSVQFIEVKQGMIRKLFGIADYIIGVHFSTTSFLVSVSNLDKSIQIELEKNMYM